MGKTSNILSKEISYDSVGDMDILKFISAIREGIKYNFFTNYAKKSPFTIPEWSYFLNISERTMQRYKKESRTFDSQQSERIVQIALLYSFGVKTFGNKTKFNSWLETENLALGHVKPKELLDNSFGINLLKDELTRIENGILA